MPTLEGLGISGFLHMQPESTGTVDAVFTGGSGLDFLFMEIEGQASHQRTVIYSDGFDSVTSIGNVQIINPNGPPIVGGTLPSL